MKRLFLTVVILLALTFCKGQTKDAIEPVNVSDLRFRSIFGFPHIDSTNVFVLLGNDYIGTTRSDDSDNLIKTWIQGHPDAAIIPVASLEPARIANRKSKLTYCWIVDKKDTLNNYLIRSGSFPEETMHRPKTWDEMTKEERGMYKELDKPNVTVYVDKSTYDKFLKEIRAAEMSAKKSGLGIWGKQNE